MKPAPAKGPWGRPGGLRYVLYLLATTLAAQPSIRTELRNGVVRAVVLHRTGESVTDDSPASPGETLSLQGDNLSGAQLFVGGTAATLDESARFTLPSDSAGSFVEISVLDGNAATVPVNAAADTQLSAAEVDALVTAAALAADGPRLAIAVTDRAGGREREPARPGR